MIQSSQYHRVLRVSAVVCAVVLVFQSGLLSDTTAQLAANTQQYMANVIGMSASVEPTELNQLTAELTAKQTELAARESALREREISVGLNGGMPAANQTTTYILASVLFILLVLILLNYALDYLRSREPELARPV
ncbi:hypothetical protein KC906_04475 [Candidatus Kaiserbacteria bacterium]|nr:hypothetical protein [Candidatus Kaiserbacteria bacterium]